MMNHSAEAPTGWRVDQTESLIRQRVLETNADVVCFQELPAMVPFVETHDLAPANTISHNGNIATIVRKELMDQMVCRAIGRFAVVCVFQKLDLTVANVHLEPTKCGAEKRLQQLVKLIDICPTKSLLIAGDTNSRVSEEEDFTAIGLEGKRPPSPTWDSRHNRHAEKSKHRSFSAYFARYLHSRNISVSEVDVLNKPINVDGESFFLSDHFALAGTANF